MSFSVLNPMVFQFKIGLLHLFCVDDIQAIGKIDSKNSRFFRFV